MSNDQRESLLSDLGNPYTNPMSDRLKLLFQYMEKETEIVKRYDEEDGIDINAEDYKPDSEMTKRLISMENYRIARTIQASVQKMIRDGLIHKDPVYVNQLDRDQRSAHNNALMSLIGMCEFAERQGLPPIYTGKLVDKHDILGMGAGNLDARREMTNFFLGLLNELSDYNIRSIENEHTRQQLSGIQTSMMKTNSRYNVKHQLSGYDDEIEFYK